MDLDDRSSPTDLDTATEHLNLATVLRHLPEVTVLLVDHDLRYLGAGGAGLQASGWEPGELLGRTLHEVASPREVARLEAAYRSALAGEVSRVTLTGDRQPERPHEVEVVPVRDRGGTITSAMVIARDLSDLAAHDAAAARAEQRLRAMVDSSEDMLALYDLDGVYLEVSRAARSLFGWEPEELVGTSAYDLVHPDDRAAISATHAAVLETDRVGPIEYRLRCRDGSYRWVEVVGRCLRDPVSDGRTTVQCTTRDITRRRVAEEALRASEARFRTAMLHAPVGMALIAMDGTFLEVNEALGAILGRSPSTLVGTSYRPLLERTLVEGDRPRLRSLVPRGADPIVVGAAFRRDDGTEVEVDLHVAIAHSPAGTPLNAVVQVVDTTEVRRASAQLRRANQELQRFASVASHDLRSPVATARGLLELLGTRFPRPADTAARDIIERTQRQLGRLSGTIDALLELTDTGTGPLRSEDLSAATLLTEVTDDLGPITERDGCTIDLVADATLTGDPRLLHSLLQNLVSNALRATDVDRPVRVQVTAGRDERSWRLAVTDDGDGFPAHLRDRLFEPFAHADRAGQEPGHGLGLAICARIVERHGGSIEVDHLDPGTRIRVQVPLTPADTSDRT